MTTDTRHRYQVVLIGDDHEILEDSCLAIKTDPEINMAGTGLDGSYVLDLMQTRHPGVVLTDIEIPKVDGIAATRQLRSRYPNLGIIVLTNLHRDTWLKEALDTGADRFLIRDMPRADPPAAIKRVAHGDRFMSAKPLSMLIAGYEDPNFTPDPRLRAGEKALTATERQVQQETLKGKSNAQIVKVM